MNSKTPKSNGKRPDPMLVATVIMTLITAISVLFNVFQHADNKELQEANLQLQQKTSSFDVTFENGSLIFVGDGASYSEPEQITVTPVYLTEELDVRSGRSMNLVIDSGEPDPANNKITYLGIIDRLCEYSENDPFCGENLSKLQILQVSFNVNGRKDTDDVPIGS